MDKEKDIADFAKRGDFLKTMSGMISLENDPIYQTLEEVRGRSALYIEFLAGAFLQETGLQASEVELVEQHSLDGMTISWHFQKRSDLMERVEKAVKSNEHS
jgi:hypothetical protein